MVRLHSTKVKFRRRREGKTDYYQRKRLIFQNKDKYGSRKYRLIVRFSNRYVTCQIAYATIAGDIIVTQAHSKELKRYGITVGLNNYAAAYATGLLLARRHLSKLGIAQKHQGLNESSKLGEDFDNPEFVSSDSKIERPFKAVLDIGLARSSTGAKVFGAMKGALDGGIHVPHDSKRFIGNDKETGKYDPETHRKYIFGLHVADYMKYLQENDETAYQRQFSDYINAGVTADSLEELYRTTHEKIRADPSPAAKKVVKGSPKEELTAQKRKQVAEEKIMKRQKRIQDKKDMFMAQIAATTE